MKLTSHPEVVTATDGDELRHGKLNPPLRGGAYLRFSPDGSKLLIQDNAGLFVVSRNPLQLLLYADLPDSYPAAFSADSQSVSALGRNLVLTTSLLSDPKERNQRELPAKDGCLDARLSPDSQWIACVALDLSFALYRTADMKLVFTQKPAPEFRFTPLVPVSNRHDTPFASTFGYATSRGLTALANRGLYHASLCFSLDAKFLLVNGEYRLDLPSVSKSSLSGGLRKHAGGIAAVVEPGDRVLVWEKGKDAKQQIISLHSGDVVGSVPSSPFSAVPASNNKYLLLSDFESPSRQLFDLEKSAAISVPENLGADVSGNDLALLDSQGLLKFYHLGETQPFAGGRMPLGPMHDLRAALADPTLATLAISVNGAGATYDLNSSSRIALVKSFRGVNFSSSDSAFLEVPQFGKFVPAISHWKKLGEGSLNSSEWLLGMAHDLVPSKKSFVSYFFYNFVNSSYPMVGGGGEVPFELHGHDPSTGRELWKRRYETDAPLPFADPQGARIVLGWKAHTDAARTAAKRFPPAQDEYKRQKVKDMDSYFEVLDASSGTSLGGVLVQVGAGPASFDSAYSYGDLLFLTKDQFRISLFRLSDGKPLGRLHGERPTVSDSAKILALHDGSARVDFYSLETGKRLAARTFPDLIAYLCFSETGDRLLVLTAHQEVFVLDVKKTIEAFPAPVNAESDHP